MKIEIEALLDDIPSYQMFINKIVTDLVDHRSVIVLLPSDVNPEWLRASIRRYFFENGIISEHINIKHNSSITCATQIARELHLTDSSGFSPEHATGIFHFQNLPDVIEIQFETNEIDIHPWMEFIEEWARFAHINANVGKKSPAMFLISPATLIKNCLPGTELYLSQRYWWGVPNQLELRHLCRCLSIDRTAFDLWKEHVIASLCEGDLNLLEYLWPEDGYDFNRISQKILDYALQKGWPLEAAEKTVLATRLYHNFFPVFNNAPPKSLFDSWATGLIAYSFEKGIRVKTAVHALLNNYDQLQHRFWAGQTEFLFTLIDEIRLNVCELMTQRFGKNWPTLWAMPENELELKTVKSNPSSCQWGYLGYLFNTALPLRKMEKIAGIVRKACRIRNEIAHSRHIKFQDYEDLISAIDFLNKN